MDRPIQERPAFAVTPPTCEIIIITQPNTAETAAGTNLPTPEG